MLNLFLVDELIIEGKTSYNNIKQDCFQLIFSKQNLGVFNIL